MTLGYFPTIDGQPARWSTWKDNGKTEGQICFTDFSHPVKLEPTYDKVRNQIRRTLTFRKRAGYLAHDAPGRYGIQRVEV